jgi:hypothetical protein
MQQFKKKNALHKYKGSIQRQTLLSMLIKNNESSQFKVKSVSNRNELK